MKSDEVFLRHILDEADFLLQRTQGLNVDAFVTDAVLTRACSRSVEIIGEAVKKLSTEFRSKHRQIDWQKIAGMRDRLIHAYFDVDLAILWDVIRNRIPELKREVERLLG